MAVQRKKLHWHSRITLLDNWAQRQENKFVLFTTYIGAILKSADSKTQAHPRKKDRETCLPENFPQITAHDVIDRTKVFILVVRGFVGAQILIGPFQVIGSPKLIAHMPPFCGHYRLRVRMIATDTEQCIVVPTAGFAQIYGMQYSLHEYLPQAKKYFEQFDANAIALASIFHSQEARNKNKYLK